MANIITVIGGSATLNGISGRGKLFGHAGEDELFGKSGSDILIGRPRCGLLHGIGVRSALWSVLALVILASGSAVAQPKDAPRTRVEEKKPDARSRVEERKTDTVIVDGRRMSKDEFLVEFARKKKEVEVARKKAGTAESLRARVAKETAQRIAANNAKVAEKKPPLGPAGATAAVCLKPKIAGLFYVPPAEPGFGLLLWGCGFEGYGRQLKLHLAEKEVALETPVWGKTGIQAMIPADLSGVLDQKAKLQVTLANGKTVSNLWPIEFRAARDTRTLVWSDLANIVCATQGSGDGCNPQSSEHLSESTTAVVFHSYAKLGGGLDKFFSKPLKNGWVVKGAHVQESNSASPNAVAWVKGFQPGSGPSAVGTVGWAYFGGLSPPFGIRYTLDVYVEGIRGIPYK
jgi:Ca2+-binding RTX toxin-like protein